MSSTCLPSRRREAGSGRADGAPVDRRQLLLFMSARSSERAGLDGAPHPPDTARDACFAAADGLEHARIGPSGSTHLYSTRCSSPAAGACGRIAPPAAPRALPPPGAPWRRGQRRQRSERSAALLLSHAMRHGGGGAPGGCRAVPPSAAPCGAAAPRRPSIGGAANRAPLPPAARWRPSKACRRRWTRPSQRRWTSASRTPTSSAASGAR
jgi:hypothetical protein